MLGKDIFKTKTGLDPSQNAWWEVIFKPKTNLDSSEHALDIIDNVGTFSSPKSCL
jgi:hypothetical protein